ncbi:MAG: PD-(D/E)XK nuclease family transposase, partial [Taibaiella sp.]|nr:PD-(D/E)XK nuclease family transposase [Taibaiella sp.]
MKKLVRFDWAIKRLLRNKANYAILEGLLSVLLKEDIKIDQILESESNQQTGDNKSNRVDMLVINSKREYIIIEVQINRKQDYLMRMLFGTSKLIVDNLQKGMGYNEIKKVISVNIVYFDLGQGSDYVYHGTTSFVGIHNADTLGLSKDQERLYHTSVIANLYPEYYLLKIDNFDTVAENDLDQWIYFLKNDEIKDSFNAKGLREAKNELD